MTTVQGADGNGTVRLCGPCVRRRAETTGEACPLCEGAGYLVDGARRDSVCPACDGTGAGIPCACGAEIVPSGSRVTHCEGEEGTGDGTEVHTPEACARYTPRDGWEEYRAAFARRGWRSPREGGMPEWCEPYEDGARCR